ncbi:MAG: hypothetical protein KDK39_14945 [Leptospiraceae bacterium]|nr:hypothetical protein [Leptospiraceae bacterium]
MMTRKAFLSDWPHFWRAALIVSLSALLGFASCSLFEAKEEDNTGLLLLLAAALNQSSNTCKNESGLVICIPPGLRF